MARPLMMDYLLVLPAGVSDLASAVDRSDNKPSDSSNPP